ncbi:unnamed protein product [Owenia fusiformis]|uniref:Coiled-coil domain-containing protein 43 n=1 Tax=Owenia fusiformis TaxID=6347 RepID=A0A8J1UVR2_OWEFU|nr:unnamed protein product [Owenia fusiformis]
MSGEFEVWLGNKLKAINEDVDLDVFVQYIAGVLDGEEDDEEKIDSMSGLLEEVSPENVTQLCEEIIVKWKEHQASIEVVEKPNLDEKLASIMEKQNLTTVTKREITEEERQRKEAILQQMFVSLTIFTSDEDETKNINASKVDQAEKAMREKMKLEHDTKKMKDALDREKQKQKALDRKENEKKRTAKGERRQR